MWPGTRSGAVSWAVRCILCTGHSAGRHDGFERGMVMDLVSLIIVWIIGLPLSLILGSFLGVGALLAHRKFATNPGANERILWISFIAFLAGCFGLICILNWEWLLLSVFFAIPLIFGNVMGIHTFTKR